MMEQAQRNVHNFLGPTPNWSLCIRDVYESIDGVFDRVVLDLPEPGRVAPLLASALTTGGIVCSLVPNVYQVQASVEAYRRTELFVEIETYEVLIRPWLIRGPSVRPSHAAMGHTGFLTIARRGAGPQFAILGASSEGG
jgi:tRNA (adenine57-N1/adenine58-N1)-methyltransferase